MAKVITFPKASDAVSGPSAHARQTAEARWYATEAACSLEQCWALEEVCEQILDVLQPHVVEALTTWNDVQRQHLLLLLRDLQRLLDQTSHPISENEG